MHRIALRNSARARALAANAKAGFPANLRRDSDANSVSWSSEGRTRGVPLLCYCQTWYAQRSLRVYSCSQYYSISLLFAVAFCSRPRHQPHPRSPPSSSPAYLALLSVETSRRLAVSSVCSPLPCPTRSLLTAVAGVGDGIGRVWGLRNVQGLSCHPPLPTAPLTRVQQPKRWWNSLLVSAACA